MRLNFRRLKGLLQEGDILLCSGNGLMSDLIKQGTDSDFSHVGMILKMPITNQWLALESVETYGVRCVTLKEGYLENYYGNGKGYDGKILIARLPEVQEKKDKFPALYEKAFSLLGDHYDEGDIIKITARLVGHDVGIDDDGKIKPGNSFICSEYVYTCLLAIGIKIPFDKDGFIAPSDYGSLESIEPVVNLKIP